MSPSGICMSSPSGLTLNICNSPSCLEAVKMTSLVESHAHRSLSPCLRKFHPQEQKALVWDIPTMGLQGTFSNGRQAIPLYALSLPSVASCEGSRDLKPLLVNKWTPLSSSLSKASLPSNSSLQKGCSRMRMSAGLQTKDYGRYTFRVDVTGMTERVLFDKKSRTRGLCLVHHHSPGGTDTNLYRMVFYPKPLLS